MIKYSTLKFIRFYQKILSPDQGILSVLSLRRVCRFYPSCSEYSYQAIQKYGLIMGCWKGLGRILRCHPWNRGGVDLP